MPSKEAILAFLDKIIAVGEVFAPMTPIPWDDMFVRFLKWARDDDAFTGWFGAYTAPAPGAFTAIPEALTDSIRRWAEATGEAAQPGKWMQLIQLLLQLADWWAKNKPAGGSPA